MGTDRRDHPDPERVSQPDGHAEPLEPLVAAPSLNPQNTSDFRIVAIGASAGGLESLERLFAYLPPTTGMAFVVLQHLSPDFKSLMDELLSRRTPMKIRQAAHGIAVEPDTIYLLPPNGEPAESRSRNPPRARLLASSRNCAGARKRVAACVCRECYRCCGEPLVGSSRLAAAVWSGSAGWPESACGRCRADVDRCGGCLDPCATCIAPGSCPDAPARVTFHGYVASAFTGCE